MKRTRVLAMLMALVLCLTLLPLGALADEELAEEPAVEVIAEEPAAEELAEEPAVEELAEEPAAEEPAEEAPVEEAEEAPAEDGITTYMGKTNDDWAYAEFGYTGLQNGKAVLRAVVDTNRTNVTYAWAKGDGSEQEGDDASRKYTKISGATGDSYTATANGVYRCTVTDGSGNVCKIYFHVTADSGYDYYVHPDGCETGDTYIRITVASGKSTTLKTVVEGSDLTNLTYEWYTYGDGPEGTLLSKKGNTYTLKNVTERSDYWCDVYKDGNYIGRAWFFIIPNITAYPTDGNPGDDYLYLTVSKGDNVTLRVTAKAADGSALTYYWSYYDEKKDEWVEKEGTNKFTLKNVTVPMDVDCYVYDENGNYASVWFYVVIDNHLEAHPAGAAAGTDEVTLTGKPGDSFTLEVVATADDTSNLTYHWANGFASSWNMPNMSGSSNKLLVEYVPDCVVYICQVSDGYGNGELVYFYLDVSTTTGTWKKASGGWWYQFSDGSYPKSQMLEIDGVKYYFNASGYLYSGWKQVDGNWYYFTSSGAATGWKKVSGTWYYFDADGVMLTGLQTIGGVKYYFKDSGAMKTGWQQIGVGSYGGEIIYEWFYFSSSGAMQTGWLKSGGKWYYFNKDGWMVTGWQTISGARYYFKSSGAMATGWQQISVRGNADDDVNKWFYFNSSGAMQTGWLKSGGKWYYLKEDGAMAVNVTLNIDGTNYKFNASGVWVS